MPNTAKTSSFRTVSGGKPLRAGSATARCPPLVGGHRAELAFPCANGKSGSRVADLIAEYVGPGPDDPAHAAADQRAHQSGVARRRCVRRLPGTRHRGEPLNHVEATPRSAGRCCGAGRGRVLGRCWVGRRRLTRARRRRWWRFAGTRRRRWSRLRCRARFRRRRSRCRCRRGGRSGCGRRSRSGCRCGCGTTSGRRSRSGRLARKCPGGQHWVGTGWPANGRYGAGQRFRRHIGIGGTGWQRDDPSRVARSPHEHRADVVLRGVVAEDCPGKLAAVVQVGIPGAQVRSSRQRCVMDVVRVAAPIAVAVDGESLPGRRDELHGPNGPIPRGVAVEPTAVGVRNRSQPRTTRKLRT